MAPRLQAEIARDESGTCFLTSPSATEAGGGRYGVGSVLCDKYRLDARLGEGAMGVVWQATNLQLDCDVAIKLTHAELTGGDFQERLQFEARAAAGLGHPAIVRIFDVGQTELGDPFIVMELLHGSTLAQRLMQGRLAAVPAVQLVLPLVDALAAMHARGVVHRDVKPDNIFISMEDQRVQPKLLDFGIAQHAATRGSDLRLRENGTLVGSPEYMSPEQAAARSDVDFRSDIWAICVVLYEAIAGKTPFDGPNNGALLRAIVKEAPPPLARRDGVDRELWQIIRRGLSKDRFARHASMQDLGRALAGWLLSHGTTEDVCGTSLDSKWAPASSEARRAARRRRTRAVQVCTLGGALALGLYIVAPKDKVESSVPVSRNATSIGPEQAPSWEGKLAPASPEQDVRARTLVATSKEPTPEVSPIEPLPAPSLKRKLPGGTPPSGGTKKVASGGSRESLSRPVAMTNGTDLDLIAPY